MSAPSRQGLPTSYVSGGAGACDPRYRRGILERSALDRSANAFLDDETINRDIASISKSLLTIGKNMRKTLLFALFISLNAPAAERTLNNGNLVLQDIPVIPVSMIDDLNRYQNARSASFQAWSLDGKSLFVRTRFGDVPQIHKVSTPGGARSQLTFFSEPIGSINRNPNSNELVFTMDAGGSEFSQVFFFDPESGSARMVTDGESRNGSVTFNRDGSGIAYASTERNGRSNDIWVMDVGESAEREITFEAPDGTYWSPSDFTADKEGLLITNYVAVVDSRIHLKNQLTGKVTQLRGGGTNKSINLAIGFDADDQGFFFITNEGSEFAQLAWARLDDPDNIVRITNNINWDIDDVILSDDRLRAAFVVNEGGIHRLYLLDTRTRKFAEVDGLPTGLVGKLAFSPSGRALAMTLNTPKTPSDTFVLALKDNPTLHGALTRWTTSEVGGLNTEDFAVPELIEYETFDNRKIPAFLYKPQGKGPFPVVISIHGGPESQALPSFSSTYQMWLAKLGVAILVPNVRGSDGYGKSYLQLDDGFKRENSVKDIGTLLDWVEQQPELDKNRVAVFGGSYGGYMVLASSVLFSDRLKAAVDVVGISSFVTFLENTQDYRRDLRRAEYGDERDPEMRAHLEKISPLNNAEQIKVPMLVVQGQNDPRVPVTESQQLVDQLREQGQTVWYMNALNEGHGFRKKENRDIYQQVTVLFLKEFLLGK